MPKPFRSYTTQQATTIRQALIYKGDDLLLPTVDWPRLLKALEDTVRIGHGLGLHKRHTLHPDDVAKRFARFTTALDAVEQKHKALGERLQFYFDSHYDVLVTVAPPFDQVLAAIGVARLAADKAAQTATRTSPVRKKGKSKNEVIRWVVGNLLEAFEAATGIPPTVYASGYATDGYYGKAYPFVKACLAPVQLVSAKRLGSAILTAYKAWEKVSSHPFNPSI